MAVFIIGEAGVNHNGDINLAKKLVDVAVQAGADAIKFQTFKAEESTGIFADKAVYQKENSNIKESQLEMLRRLELPFRQFDEIKAYCEEKGIIFLSTPDGTVSLNYLIKLDVPMIKIGSTEITNHKFLREIALTGKPLILSTGMSSLGEVEKALEVIAETGNDEVTILQCTTDYPTAFEDVNIKTLKTLNLAFGKEVGFSDHTIGFEAAIAAVAFGATMIEKHITLDSAMEGPDHAASMNPEDFSKFVSSIRNTEKILGSSIKKATSREKEMKKTVRRSVMAAYDIEKDTILTEDMLVYKRPGTGIAPELSYILIGRTINRNISKEELILWDDV